MEDDSDTVWKLIKDFLYDSEIWTFIVIGASFSLLALEWWCV